MLAVAVYFLLFQNVLSLHISIDGEKGNDSRHCIQGQVSCQSLQYVAIKTNRLSNVTIVAIGSSLSLSGSAVFVGNNGLTLTGNIKCNQSYSCNFNGSGIVFKHCKNVALYNFTIENCGLYSKVQSQLRQFITGIQAVIFAFCEDITLMQATLHNNNGAGLLLYNSNGSITIINCTFSSNVCYHCKSNNFDVGNGVCSQGRKPDLHLPTNINGGGLAIYQDLLLMVRNITIMYCQFINNVASNEGGAVNVVFVENSIMMNVRNCIFLNNKAGSNGGAVIIKLSQKDFIIVYKYIFTDCNFIGNEAQFGGGFMIVVQIPPYPHLYWSAISKPKSRAEFHNCSFNGNKAEVSAAVDVNIRDFFHFSIAFHQCQFKNNILSSSHSNAIKSVVLFANVAVTFTGNSIFSNNSGTVLYLAGSKAIFFYFSNTEFFNNTSSGNGGAILLSDNSLIVVYSNSTLVFINNTAVVGGAICALQSASQKCLLYAQGSSKCYLQ